MRKGKLLVLGLIGAGIVLNSCVPKPKLERVEKIDKEVLTAFEENQKMVDDVKNSFSYKANTSMFFPYLLTVGVAESTASAVGGIPSTITAKALSLASTVAVEKNGFGVKVLYEDNTIKTKECKFFPFVWTKDENLYHEMFEKVDLLAPNLRNYWFLDHLLGKYNPAIPIIPFNNYGVKFARNKEEVKNRFVMFVFDGRRPRVYEAYPTMTYIGRVDIDGKPARMFLLTGAQNGYAWEEMRKQISMTCEKKE